MATLAGCELEQVTVIEVEDVVIAEVYVSLAADPVDHELRAFLHRTLGSPGGNVEALADASITVTRSDGVSFPLFPPPLVPPAYTRRPPPPRHNRNHPHRLHPTVDTVPRPAMPWQQPA